MKPTEIQAVFAALLDTFEPINGQPTDDDLTRLQNSALGVFVPISFDRELGRRNLMGLMLSVVKYKGGYEDLPFPSYFKRPVIYNGTIVDEATLGVHTKAKAKRKAKLDNWKIFNCTQRKVCVFIIACVEDMYIRELRGSVTGYSYVAPHVIMRHL